MNDVSTVIFQRSEAGRDEIKHKTHGLTQSERLVLIMVDGITARGAIRAKLPALTDERFDRALRRLREKELILEVFMPIEGQDAETLEQAVIERFLHQDPMDPVTIIVSDPEDEFGVPMPAAMQSSGVPPASLAPAPLETANPLAVAPPPTAAPIPELKERERTLAVPAMDAVHNALADSLAEEVRLRQAQRMQSRESPENSIPIAKGSTDVQEKRGIGLHWGYWFIALGCAFIGTYVATHLVK